MHAIEHCQVAVGMGLLDADGCVGDDRYEYTTVADPFFADLGEVLARALLLEPNGEKRVPAQSR